MIDNAKDAKKTLKKHIKFLEEMIMHIRKGEEPMLSNAMWAAWCLHRYIEDKLIEDITKAIQYNSKKDIN